MYKRQLTAIKGVGRPVIDAVTEERTVRGPFLRDVYKRQEQYVVEGVNPLVGEVEIGGAKNAALAILAASVMTDERCV